ncbi:KWG Leptospira [Moraxella lacunata]|uniref:KWG Leptospira n=1 Tax=Moraxella lacunata TaxID=477 RepID=A0A378QF49_MORLA|nr:WG repeat-containing protein [Moraxella lacunata]STY98884.1 KWG Leptospira [Moraxella lacunata]
MKPLFWLCGIGLAFGVANVANADEFDASCVKPTTQIPFTYQECLNQKGVARVGNMVQTPFGDFPYPIGLIDKTGKLILPALYHEIDFPDDWAYDSNTEPSDVLIVVTQRNSQESMFGKLGKNDTFGLVNEQGEFVVPMGFYDDIGGFYRGLSRVAKDGKYGYIDSRASVVIPVVYDYAGLSFIDGFASVKGQGKYGIIDKQNRPVIAFIYDGAEVLSERLFAVAKDEQYALMSPDGKFLSDYQYEMIIPAYYGDTYVVRQQGKYGLINEQAEVLIAPKYDYVGVDFEKTYADDNTDDKIYFKAELGDSTESFAITRK